VNGWMVNEVVVVVGWLVLAAASIGWQVDLL
jgi:hypothetical protein